MNMHADMKYRHLIWNLLALKQKFSIHLSCTTHKSLPVSCLFLIAEMKSSRTGTSESHSPFPLNTLYWIAFEGYWWCGLAWGRSRDILRWSIHIELHVQTFSPSLSTWDSWALYSYWTIIHLKFQLHYWPLHNRLLKGNKSFLAQSRISIKGDEWMKTYEKAHVPAFPQRCNSGLELQ